MKRCLGALSILAGLLFPFAVYFGQGSRYLALILGGAYLMRCWNAPAALRWTGLAGFTFCVLMASLDTPALSRWYPAFVNTGMFALFLVSLYHGKPIIEQIARLQEPDLPVHAVAYTRRVTQVWTGFFLFNGLIAAGLALAAPLAWWTIYNGVIAYALIGSLLLGERVYRRRFREPA